MCSHVLCSFHMLTFVTVFHRFRFAQLPGSFESQIMHAKTWAKGWLKLETKLGQTWAVRTKIPKSSGKKRSQLTGMRPLASFSHFPRRWLLKRRNLSQPKVHIWAAGCCDAVHGVCAHLSMSISSSGCPQFPFFVRKRGHPASSDAQSLLRWKNVWQPHLHARSPIRLGVPIQGQPWKCWTPKN